MKKLQAVDLFRILKYLEQRVDSGELAVKTKFSYAILTNLAVLESLIEIIKKVSDPSEDFKKYDIERVELAKKYSEKGGDGQPIVENNSYKLVGDGLTKFNEEFEKFKRLNKDTLDKRVKQLKEVEELLQEDVEVTLQKVKLEILPEEGLTPAMLKIMNVILEKE
jgi:DNA-binding transcriptional ArsR family regulator